MVEDPPSFDSVSDTRVEARVKTRSNFFEENTPGSVHFQNVFADCECAVIPDKQEAEAGVGDSAKAKHNDTKMYT